MVAYLAPQEIVLPDQKRLKDWAKRIWDAKADNWFSWDDPGEVRQVFSEMKDAVEVAALARTFYADPNIRRDLWQYLNTFLDEDEIETNVNIPVRRLAAYRIKS